MGKNHISKQEEKFFFFLVGAPYSACEHMKSKEKWAT